jgi:hypothetical protein
MTTIQENSDELGPVHDWVRRSVRGMGRIGGVGLTQRERSHVGLRAFWNREPPKPVDRHLAAQFNRHSCRG